jgi:hypothetical protein
MNTAPDTQKIQTMTYSPDPMRVERRQHRRHDLETQGLPVERYTGQERDVLHLGRLIDLSSGGVRVRTKQANIRPDQQIRIRLQLPTYAGISPFVDAASMRPTGEWVGWLAVSRVKQVGSEFEVAGRLMDMEELDRGMLGLYLSTQPLAA